MGFNGFIGKKINENLKKYQSEKKILGAVLDLSPKWHSQFPPIMGWIGCAI